MTAPPPIPPVFSLKPFRVEYSLSAPTVLGLRKDRCALYAPKAAPKADNRSLCLIALVHLKTMVSEAKKKRAAAKKAKALPAKVKLGPDICYGLQLVL